jgi:hypothetical protein
MANKEDNTPEKMLARGARLIRQPSGWNTLVRFTHGALEYLEERVGRLALEHSVRFRKVSTRYPRRVTEAYGGNLTQAMADSEEQVAPKVVSWEISQGYAPRDWAAIGAEERDEVVA